MFNRQMEVISQTEMLEIQGMKSEMENSFQVINKQHRLQKKSVNLNIDQQKFKLEHKEKKE